jgi:hypothetical protein
VRGGNGRGVVGDVDGAVGMVWLADDAAHIEDPELENGINVVAMRAEREHTMNDSRKRIAQRAYGPMTS